MDNFLLRSAECSNVTGVQWDRFFDDLEDQLAAQYEAERAALDSETERLRLSRMPFRDRLTSLIGRERHHNAPGFALADGSVLSAEVTGLGVDWVAVEPVERPGHGVIVPMGAIVAVTLSQQDLLHSARPLSSSASALSERITFGFVLRDLVRRRAPVSVHLRAGTSLTGTIDRAGSDHFDIALHDRGAPRRSSDVSGYRLVPLDAVVWVRLDGSSPT